MTIASGGGEGGGGSNFLILESVKVYCFIASVRISDLLNDLAK